MTSIYQSAHDLGGGVGAGTAAQTATLRPYRNARTTSTEIENFQIISGPTTTNSATHCSYWNYSASSLCSALRATRIWAENCSSHQIPNHRRFHDDRTAAPPIHAADCALSCSTLRGRRSGLQHSINFPPPSSAHLRTHPNQQSAPHRSPKIRNPRPI